LEPFRTGSGPGSATLYHRRDDTARSAALKITWYAHACFRLKGSGLTIVTDPYTPEDAGLPRVTDPADSSLRRRSNSAA
jgi:hypothetical protein